MEVRGGEIEHPTRQDDPETAVEIEAAKPTNQDRGFFNALLELLRPRNREASQHTPGEDRSPK